MLVQAKTYSTLSRTFRALSISSSVESPVETMIGLPVAFSFSKNYLSVNIAEATLWYFTSTLFSISSTLSKSQQDTIKSKPKFLV